MFFYCLICDVMRRDSLIVPIVNVLTSFYAGFVIFSVLGYMAKLKGVSVDEVAASGIVFVFIQTHPVYIVILGVSVLKALNIRFSCATFSSA